MVKNKKKDTEVTSDIKYIELLSDSLREDMKDIKLDVKEVSYSLLGISKELGGVAQSIRGSEARIKTLEGGYSDLRGEVTKISSSHPNGSLKVLVLRMAPWLIAALLMGAAFTGYAFSGLSDDGGDLVKAIEKKLDAKIDTKVNSELKQISNDIEYLISQESDGGI